MRTEDNSYVKRSFPDLNENDHPWEEILKDVKLLRPDYFALSPIVQKKDEDEDDIDYLEKGSKATDFVLDNVNTQEDKKDETVSAPLEDKESDNGEKEQQDNTKIDAVIALDRKMIGLYFSAGWCPPCKQFTPLLKDFYEEVHRRNAPFEVVFVSFDKNEEDMKEYYRKFHGDWLAVPFDDPLKENLKKRFKIHVVPKLIVVTSHGEVITMRGRKEIQDKGIICFRNWQEICSFRENRAKSQASVQGLETKESDNL